MKEFEKIIKDIINNEEFLKLKNEEHHSSNRYDHCYRVAYDTYKYLKKHNLDYVDATRAALLHDFFFDAELGKSQAKRLNQHPKVALENALKYFDLNDKEQNIILAHMYPISSVIPKYKESWIVSLMDKKATFQEFRIYGIKKSIIRIINVKRIKKVA